MSFLSPAVVSFIAIILALGLGSIVALNPYRTDRSNKGGWQ